MKRYEKKFGFIPKIKPDLENILSCEGFKKSYPRRTISSFYYDDASFSSYTNSVRGHGSRLKTRARIYNMDSSRIILERKLRDNDLGHKSYDFLLADKGEDFEVLYRDGTSESPITIMLPKTLDGSNKPLLVVHYTRDYYQSFLHPDLRVTIDSKIGYGRIHMRRGSSIATIDHWINRCVLEIKVPQHHENLIAYGAKLLERQCLVNERHSKYCNAVEVLF